MPAVQEACDVDNAETPSTPAGADVRTTFALFFCLVRMKTQNT
jgi:hypothetical protein